MHRLASFESIGGKKVFQILTTPDVPSKKIVIMSHGFRGSTIGPSRTFVDFEKILVKNNFCVLRFDQPNCGNSEGDFVDSSFDEWVSTIIYFTKRYLNLDYSVVLFGQSMGATATTIATSNPELIKRIPCIILWVPDPKSTFESEGAELGEEGGQKYRESFWREARKADFFTCLENYKGGIHLVYGENDKYISQELRNKVIEKVKEKNQPFMILPNQDHSPWAFDITQEVFLTELKFIREHLASLA